MRLAIGLEEEEEERDRAVVLNFVERRSFLGQRLRRGDGERAIRLPTPNLESAEKIIGSARLIRDSYKIKTEMVIRPKRKALRTLALGCSHIQNCLRSSCHKRTAKRDGYHGQNCFYWVKIGLSFVFLEPKTISFNFFYFSKLEETK